MEKSNAIATALACNACVEILQQVCGETDLGDRDQVTHLAAHVFAVASRLHVIAGSARLASPLEVTFPVRTTTEAVEAIAALGSDTPPASLFWLCSVCLEVFDHQLSYGSDSYLTRRIPERTRLRPNEASGLSGEVVHWVRPPSALGRERRRRAAAAAAVEAEDRSGKGSPPRLPRAGTPHPGDFLAGVAMHWNSDPQLFPLRPWRPPAAAEDLIVASGRDASSGSFRIALCPLPGPYHPQFRVSDDGRFFRSIDGDSLKDGDLLLTELDRLLEVSKRERVNLLVLPELMVGSSARARMLERLRASGDTFPHGIVAGSFHVWREGEDFAKATPVNECRVIAPPGQDLLVHHKRGKFGLSATDVAANPDWFPLRPQPMPNVPEVIEDIRWNADVNVLETTLGRFLVAICADCIARDHTSLEALIERLRPDFLLVVAMSPKTEDFERFISRTAQKGIGTLFVNAACICGNPPRPPTGPPLLAAVDLALHENAEDPPTRIRWRQGWPDAEVVFYHPADRNTGWQAASSAQPSACISWLYEGTQRLALVVDLGVYLRG